MSINRELILDKSSDPRSSPFLFVPPPPKDISNEVRPVAMAT